MSDSWGKCLLHVVYGRSVLHYHRGSDCQATDIVWECKATSVCKKYYITKEGEHGNNENGDIAIGHLAMVDSACQPTEVSY